MLDNQGNAIAEPFRGADLLLKSACSALGIMVFLGLSLASGTLTYNTNDKKEIERLEAEFKDLRKKIDQLHSSFSKDWIPHVYRQLPHETSSTSLGLDCWLCIIDALSGLSP